jgi:hypothetical protein
MKRIGVIVLSIFVLYGGVASALEKCWAREGHADHLASETHHDSYSSLGHSHPSDDSVSLIHCCSFGNRVGPATKTAATNLHRPIEGVSLDKAHSILSTASMELSLTRLLIFLRRILTFSFYSDLGQHLLLSVLRI